MTRLDVIHHTEKNLISLGMQSGMRVGLRLPNQAAYAVVITACWRIGVVPVPLSIRYTYQQIQSAVQDMGCHAIIAGDLDRSAFSVPVVTLDQICDDDRYTFGGVFWYDLDLGLGQEATIVLTSGSMGRPRGVLHTFGNHYYSALGSHETIPFGRDDVWLVSLPLYHVGGLSLIMRSLLHGGTLWFAQEHWQHDLINQRITHISLVPTQLKCLLDDSKASQTLRKLKVVLVGGAPCPENLVMRAVDLNIPIHLTYGLTEAASQVTTTSSGEVAEHPTCCGQVLPHRKLCIARDGDILVAGRTLCKAIVSGNETIDPFDEDGWFHTGDVGSLDAQDRLIVQGRKDAMFISGGENIHPEEIEQALLQLPEVQQCVVVAVPDDQYGQRPAVFIRVSENRSLSRSEFQGALETLERFKQPDYFFDWPSEAPKGVKPDRAWFATHALRLIQSNRFK